MATQKDKQHALSPDANRLIRGHKLLFIDKPKIKSVERSPKMRGDQKIHDIFNTEKFYKTSGGKNYVSKNWRHMPADMKQMYMSIFKQKSLIENENKEHFPFITNGLCATPDVLIATNTNINKKSKKK